MNIPDADLYCLLDGIELRADALTLMVMNSKVPDKAREDFVNAINQAHDDLRGAIAASLEGV